MKVFLVAVVVGVLSSGDCQPQQRIKRQLSDGYGVPAGPVISGGGSGSGSVGGYQPSYKPQGGGGGGGGGKPSYKPQTGGNGGKKPSIGGFFGKKPSLGGLFGGGGSKPDIFGHLKGKLKKPFSLFGGKKPFGNGGGSKPSYGAITKPTYGGGQGGKGGFDLSGIKSLKKGLVGGLIGAKSAVLKGIFGAKKALLGGLGGIFGVKKAILSLPLKIAGKVKGGLLELKGGVLSAKGAIIGAKGQLLKSIGQALKGGIGGKKPSGGGGGSYGVPTTEYGGPRPNTEYGGPRPSGEYGGPRPSGGSGGPVRPAYRPPTNPVRPPTLPVRPPTLPVVPISDGYGVPSAAVVTASGGNSGYGAPGPEGFGPSSAVSEYEGPSLVEVVNPRGQLPAASVAAPEVVAIDTYTAAADPIISESAAVPVIDEYGAPAADPIGSGSDPVPAIDSYGAPAAPVIQSSPSIPEPAISAPDAYGAPSADVISVVSPEEPIISDNSGEDSYGSEVSSYDAPAVPAGYAF